MFLADANADKLGLTWKAKGLQEMGEGEYFVSSKRSHKIFFQDQNYGAEQTPYRKK